MVSNRTFFVVYTTFFLFITQMIGLMAEDIPLSDTITIPSIVTDSTTPTGISGMITAFLANVGFFFELMTVSTSYFLLGSLVLSPFIVGVSWALLEIIKDLVPLT